MISSAINASGTFSLHWAKPAIDINRVVGAESGQTFREQAKVWLSLCITRRRKPIKPATIRGWESYLEKWLNPLIGDTLLVRVNNSTLKTVVTHLCDAKLSPKTIRNIVQVVTMVMASALNEEGEQIHPRKWNYEFADVPLIGDQRTPMFTGENVSRIVAETQGQARIVFALLASSGLRAGEVFALEVKHFNGNTLTIEQSPWEGKLQTPKTRNAFRQVDLSSSVADALRAFIGDRSDGVLFRNAEQKPIHQSNFLRRYLHPTLKKLGIEKQGFHGFRRFRVTHLESSGVPTALVQYWTGHARSADGAVSSRQSPTRYVKMAKDTQFRAEVAERVGIGFELPNPVVPGVPRKAEEEVSVNI